MKKIDIHRTRHSVMLDDELMKKLRVHCALQGVRVQTALENAVKAYLDGECGRQVDKLVREAAKQQAARS